MMKRLLCLLLALIMIVGVCPTGVFASEAEAMEEVTLDPIKIDFKAFAKEASEQDWWEELPTVITTDGYETKRIGTARGTAATAEAKVAAAAMQTWMEETMAWHFDVEASEYVKYADGNRLYLCADEDVAWGVLHNTYYHNAADDRDVMAINVTAPEEGWYKLETALEHVMKNASHPNDSGFSTHNYGYFSVSVNGTVVYPEYSFNGVGVKKSNLGTVYLQEGENSIHIKAVKNYVGNTNVTPAYACKFVSMTLTPLGDLTVGLGVQKALDIVGVYLPADSTVSPETHRAISDDEDIAKAWISEEGKLMIEGISEGKASLTLMEGLNEVCTVKVEIVRIDMSKVAPITVDFKEFAKQVSVKEWYKDLPTLENWDGTQSKRLGQTYNKNMSDTEYAAYVSMKNDLADADWTFNVPNWDANGKSGQRAYLCADDSVEWGLLIHTYMINKGIDSQVAFDLNVKTDGWYTLNLDVSRQNTASKDYPNDAGTDAGSGRMDVYVNGELVDDDRSNIGEGMSRLSYGPFYLTEGVNTVALQNVSNYQGTWSGTYGGRCCIALRGVELRPLGGEAVEAGDEKYLNLANTYLPGRTDLADVTVTCDDRDIAEAELDGNTLILSGREVGFTTVTLYDGEVALTSFDVRVTEAVSSAGASTVTVEETGWYQPQITFYKSSAFTKTDFTLGDTYLGSALTNADAEQVTTAALSYVYLEEGDYALTASEDLDIVGIRLLPIEKPELTLGGHAMSGKQFRTYTTELRGWWEDFRLGDSLTDAEWEVEVSDEAVLEADLASAGIGKTPVLTVRGLQVSDDAWVKITATIGDETASVKLPVTVLAPAKLQSMDVELKGVKQQIARNTLQHFSYAMVGEDGDVIYPDEVDISYTVSDPAVAEVDETAHTLFAKTNGDVTVTVTVTSGDAVFTEIFDFTVADVGENKLSDAMAAFDTLDGWAGVYTADDGFMRNEVVQEDGNNVFAFVLTGNAYKPSAYKGAAIYPANGSFAELLPGHYYEYSFDVKIEGYEKAPNAGGQLQFLPQLYDYQVNAWSGATLSEVNTTSRENFTALPAEWTTYKLKIRGPFDGDKIAYGMTRINFDTFYNYPNDAYETGWKGTVYVDNVSIREVGLDHVAVELSAPMTNIDTPVTATLYPMSTTGSKIYLDKGTLDGKSTLSVTNEDVMTVVRGEKMVAESDFDFPTYQVQLVGLNGEVDLEATLDVAGRTIEGTLPVTASGLSEVIRDIRYTLDGFDSAVLPVGQTAVGETTGRTTFLNTIAEEDFEMCYYVSSDPSVAKVDARTGEVTTVGEGTATITAYAIYDGATKSDTALITVTDDTDLASIALSSVVDFVGVGNEMDIAVSGLKSSGVKADMSLYPVAWTVSDESLAMISETGRLTGLAEGTVTVTATVGVERRAVTASMDVKVVSDQDLPTDGYIWLNFSAGQAILAMDATLEDDGYEIDWSKTYNDDSFTMDSHSMELNIPKDKQFVMDVMIRKSGWYQFFMDGTHFYYKGATCNVFMDSSYVGQIDYRAEGTGYTGAGGYRNTLYMEVGKHTLVFTSLNDGPQRLGQLRMILVDDPRTVDVQIDVKQDLVVGEAVAVQIDLTDANGNDFYLLDSTSDPKVDNYQILSVSDTSVLSLSGKTLTAVGVGTAKVLLKGKIHGENFLREVEVTVTGGDVISAELSAERTTVRPGSDAFPLTLAVFGVGGKMETLPEGVSVTYTTSDSAIFTVTDDGMAHPGTTYGSALITAAIDENGREVTATIWLSVTEGKTEPTLYTYEERANAQANALKYDWAWREKEAAVKKADVIVANIDVLYELWMPETFPTSCATGLRTSLNNNVCPVCETNLTDVPGIGSYGWLIDPINYPWKIRCMKCKAQLPSNDFGAYFHSGIDPETGKFSYDLADDSLLVNTLYPEKGEKWGVDNGFGWDTGNKCSNGVDEVYTFIAYYMSTLYGVDMERDPYSARVALQNLMDAYMYTGDEKYGSAGAILIDRYADILPTYDWSESDFVGVYSHSIGFSHGGGYDGKIIGVTWDSILFKTLTAAADAFWPAMDNPDVVEYLQGKAYMKGLQPEEITPQQIRDNVDTGIYKEVFHAVYTHDAWGNFGMSQCAVARAAVGIDDDVLTPQWLEWLFQERVVVNQGSNKIVLGDDMLRYVVQDFSRDGIGNECSYNYNAIMTDHCLDVADALVGMGEYDLWANPKFVNLFLGMMRFQTCGNNPINLHESGSVQSQVNLSRMDNMLIAYTKTGNRDLARAIYSANGNKVDGLRGDIFMKDPESIKASILKVVQEEGGWDASDSDMMSGYGVAILREGPETFIQGQNDSQFSDFYMYFGYTNWGHAQREVLNLDLDAFGLNVSSHFGYPVNVTGDDPERMQFVCSTISNNTVIVNDKEQLWTDNDGDPMHFEDAGRVKVMDAENTGAYNEVDIYRRSVVTVKAENGVEYAVDFFRVLGGNEHLYAFHAVSLEDPDTTGLDLVQQPMGTYAGPDVPWGPAPGVHAAMTGDGYSWLYDVYRDDAPDTTFSMDWSILDYHHSLIDSDGIHMRLTMLSEAPYTEVATANAKPPRNGKNPEHMEFMLVRHSGEDGLDSLFTTIIEPYKFDPLIASSELVEVELMEGTEGLTDRAVAVKATLVGGRVDYIIYATNPDCTYKIDDRITFRGFTGVFSYEGDTLVYAWGNEASHLEDRDLGAVAEDVLPAVTGKVVDFTKGLAEEYFMTLSMDVPVAEEAFEGKYVYVDNNNVEKNGAYRIHGAKVEGDLVTLNLAHQDLIRKLADGSDLSKGYIYNISEGNSYTIPLSVTFDTASFFNYTSDTVVKAGNKLSLATGAVGAGVTYALEGASTGMKFDARTGTIAWTTSKTMVGRYPVTVKAVDAEGDVLATMSFTIYVVNYTGSAYEASKCSHAKAVSFEADGMIETVCPACGTVSKTAAPVGKFAFVGSNMTLGNELKLNF
ncbi:MAG: Ig-like domain-containing protein, partial [Oscillospiraceae bacterium]|nr:Ig-like domain-containing protein [Oscillospiraceae bacterium]